MTPNPNLSQIPWELKITEGSLLKLMQLPSNTVILWNTSKTTLIMLLTSSRRSSWSVKQLPKATKKWFHSTCRGHPSICQTNLQLVTSPKRVVEAVRNHQFIRQLQVSLVTLHKIDTLKKILSSKLCLREINLQKLKIQAKMLFLNE